MKDLDFYLEKIKSESRIHKYLDICRIRVNFLNLIFNRSQKSYELLLQAINKVFRNNKKKIVDLSFYRPDDKDNLEITEPMGNFKSSQKLYKIKNMSQLYVKVLLRNPENVVEGIYKEYLKGNCKSIHFNPVEILVSKFENMGKLYEIFFKVRISYKPNNFHVFLIPYLIKRVPRNLEKKSLKILRKTRPLNTEELKRSLDIAEILSEEIFYKY
ncbi:MAG: hypothetical protein J7L39_02160 [Candidatus Aenigmarchaeota archaeon]|nr:hypothetical protein [Candidatus Aenigmarchaeota archaeon]